jgi:UDP-glucose 4-epimerase
MKVLVTGGAGFIGSNLVRHLVSARQHEIAVLDNLSVGLTEHGLPREARFLRGDFTDRETMAQALRSIDVVVHLAALSGVIDSVEDPGPSFEVNVAGSFRLLELARRLGVRKVICASTGGALLGDVAPPISESHAPAPLSPYGASKLAMEGYCSAFAGAYGLACTTLRFSNVYGPFSGHKKSVVAAFTKQALRGEPLVVYGDGTQERDYLFVGDLVRGVEAVIGRDIVGTFQLGSGRPTSLLQLIDALKVIAQRKLDVRHEPARRGEVHRTWCDVSKARHAFGFATPTTLPDGLRATWSWFAENRGAWEGLTRMVSAD